MCERVWPPTSPVAALVTRKLKTDDRQAEQLQSRPEARPLTLA